VDWIIRKGVRFTCEKCGKLLKKCNVHNPVDKGGCPSCKGNLKRVGVGNHMVGGAGWYKCLKCKKYFMSRRGEVVETRARDGFDKFA
jgi:transposase-like protein